MVTDTRGPLPVRHQLIYLIAWFVPYAFLGVLAFEPNDWDWLNSGITVVTSASGPYLCYRSNGGRDGERFLERAIPVCFVVSLRMLPAVAALVMLVLAWCGTSTGPELVMVTLLCQFLFYWRSCVHLERVRRMRS